MTNSTGDDGRSEKKPDSNRPGGQGPTKFPRNMFSWILFLLLGVMLLTLLKGVGQRNKEITFSEFQDRLENREVEKVTVFNDRVTGQMKESAMEGKDPETASFKVQLISGTGKEGWFTTLLTASGAEVVNEAPNTMLQILIGILPWLLIFGVLYFFVFRQFRGGMGGGMLGNFGRSRHRVTTKDQTKTTFDNVAGIDEAKDEVQEIIHFLSDPKKFQRLGGRIPRGILLIGEPGCGKTLLAKAIAGEADVPFFSISGSDFVEMFVGVGASRVRDLFKQAKENAPCIIFLDEIDAIGRKRGSGVAGGGNDEREQTLNAILVEMDGFSTNDQVIVIAATNRADVLDKALTRTGRFDRQVYVPLPDVKGRLEILKVHMKKVKLAPKTDMSRLARGTPMFSGADLEAIINEAALAATMLGKDFVEMSDFEEARDKVRWGRARRSRQVDEKDREITAYHEAGHALVQSMLEHADPLHKVSIIPRAGMGGATFSLPEKDRTMYSKQFCLALIRVCFGGRVAEELYCGDISSGASSDISQATEVARKMVMEWGMSEKLGFVSYGSDEGGMQWPPEFGAGREYSDHTAQLIDAEIKEIMDEAYSEVKTMLTKYSKELVAIEEGLLKYETLDGDEVEQIIAGKPLTKPTVVDLLEAEKERSEEVKAEEPKEKPQPAPKGIIQPIPKPGMG